jgi:integrase
VLALHTGLRRGELLGLRWSCVDFERRLLRVTVALQRIDGRLVLCELKTARSRRTVMMTEGVYEALQRHKERQAAIGIQHPEGLVFTSYRGNPVNPMSLHRSFKGSLKAAGLPDMHIHDLRHAAATLLLGEGVNIKIVSEMLGHANIGITGNLYQHASENMMREAARSMEAALGK